MFSVMVAMAFMPGKQWELYASLGFLAVVVLALLVKRAIAKS